MTDIKYVAFDVHQATISAAVLDISGKLITQAVFQTEPSAIRDFLRGISGSVHLTFEEGTHLSMTSRMTNSRFIMSLLMRPSNASFQIFKSAGIRSSKTATNLSEELSEGADLRSSSNSSMSMLSE